MNNNIKNAAMFITLWSWPALGFYRGLNSYNYNYSNNKLYDKYFEKPRPLYIDKAAWGLVGTFCYLTPGFCFIAAYKEIYRLEVNLRGIEDEKKSAYYNRIL
jgi:hypothetical protein